MSKKHVRRKKSKIKFYEAPAKSRASYFFASFFITLSLLLTGLGLIVVNINSKQLGFGEDLQVFSVSCDEKQYDVSVIGSSFSVDKFYVDSAADYINRSYLTKLQNEPEPFCFFDNVLERIVSAEYELLSEYCPAT
ncbi:MAG TPA: hypothetical protein VHO66_01880 [Ruminiclostridium sp.]|nr:hypothetical protein [Ruminiclostridium sp.]